jgi:hypothetical protein
MVSPLRSIRRAAAIAPLFVAVIGCGFFPQDQLPGDGPPGAGLRTLWVEVTNVTGSDVRVVISGAGELEYRAEGVVGPCSHGNVSGPLTRAWQITISGDNVLEQALDRAPDTDQVILVDVNAHGITTSESSSRPPATDPPEPACD